MKAPTIVCGTGFISEAEAGRRESMRLAVEGTVKALSAAEPTAIPRTTEEQERDRLRRLDGQRFAQIVAPVAMSLAS